MKNQNKERLDKNKKVTGKPLKSALKFIKVNSFVFQLKKLKTISRSPNRTQFCTLSNNAKVVLWLVHLFLCAYCVQYTVKAPGVKLLSNDPD